MNRRTLLTGLSAATLLTAGARPGRADLLDDDSFESFGEEIDKEFEAFDARMDARFAAMDRAIDQAFKAMKRDLQKRWGEAAKMPSKHTWVGYTDDRGRRVIVDYEDGTITVEAQETTDRDALKRTLNETLGASSRELDQQDVVGDYVDRKAREAGDKAVSGGGQKAASREAELGRLADKDAEPDFDTRTVTDSKGRQHKVGRVTIPMLPDHKRLSAERVAPLAKAYAGKYMVDTALLLSIMKNESSFNPRAQSHIPAFGLMQIVPATGGRDAYKFVKGKDRAPSPEYLFEPEQNVELGSAYLHILMARYLEPVRDRESREYCAIAAYNTGAGNVAKTFTGDTNVSAAARQINRMNPQQVYHRLRADLPYAETKHYLKRVVRDRRRYRDMGPG